MSDERAAVEPAAEVDHRPWGKFELLTLNETTSVKIITVTPGHRLSLQTHTERSEWWTALDEGLTVEVDDRSWQPAVGERIWIPQGAAHRACNTSDHDVRFLEIAFGRFDESDIVRLQDDYVR